MVEAMSKADRAKKLEVFERWTDSVSVDQLVEVDTTALTALIELSEQRSGRREQITSRGTKSD